MADGLSPSVERPDLDEFLSALNGFLEKQTTPRDPSFLRFLEIFCRSVGSGEGHILKSTPTGDLESVMSFGISADFDTEFNEAKKNNREPSPLEEAFREQKVVAIVELKKGPDMPDWFMKLMNKHQFKSLVAVPLLGHSETVGILCAYYHDVCLFDQGTLDRLMGIGKMVGTATEKSVVAGRVEMHDAKEKAADEFLQQLTAEPFGKLEVYGMLRKMIVKGLDPVSLICGPIRSTGATPSLTIVDGEKIPPAVISRRVNLPPLIVKKFITGEWVTPPASASVADWGDLATLFKGKVSRILCQAVTWQGKSLGAVIAWRSEGDAFNADDEVLLMRLCSIASLALNSN